MKKVLLIIVLIIVIALGFTQVALPAIAERTVESELSATLQTDDVDASVSSFPAVLMLMGHFGHIDVTAKDARLGDVRVESMTLIGDAVEIPSDVLFGKATEKDAGKIRIKSANRLELRGIVTADSLKDIIERKVDKVHDVDVTLGADRAVVEGKAKLMGQDIDVHIEGRIYGEGNAIFFKMTRLDVKHSIFGLGGISGDMFGDIKLVDFTNMELPVELDNIEQQEGKVVLTASRHQGK